MKKRLNVDSIQNELRGGSAFFPGYQSSDASGEHKENPPHSPLPASTVSIEPPAKEVQASPVLPVLGVPPVRDVRPVPRKRIMKQRWPVDIYQDQYESLQQLALEERKQGGIGSMSAMVREALDRLISEKQKK